MRSLSDLFSGTDSVARRDVLRGSLLAGAGIAAAALLGCGGDDDEDAPPAATGAASQSTAAATGPGRLVKDPDLPYPFEFPDPAGQPKRGGVFVHSTNFAFT